MYNIYIIQNKITEKVYVGQTICGEKRLRNHRYYLNKGKHANSYLQNAWDLYGSDAFDFYILDSLETKEEMDEAEIYYIKWYKDLNLCYNLTEGGKSNIPSKETRIKISEASKGQHTMSKEHKEKIRQANLGKTLSEETKRKISKSLKGKKSWMEGKTHTEEIREKIRQANLGNKNSVGHIHSEETKRKIGEASKGRPCSEETKQKKSKAHLGRKHTEESKLKMSLACKNRVRSEDHQQKLNESKKGNTNMKGKKHSEETKLKISLAQLGKKHSEETKLRMSESQKNRNLNKNEEDISITSEIFEERK